jgi:hypothetical protein
MLKIRQLHWLTAAALAAAAFAAGASIAQPGAIEQVKLGFGSMSKTQQTDLWKRVDEYATVDALQEFCGTKLYLQRRALSAVGTCIEGSALRKVFATFRSKKEEYLKAWETLHGEPAHKKELCERFKSKLAEYTKIMSGEIAQAASACRNCFFC